MMKRKWIIGLGGAACLVAATVVPGLADEGQARMVCGQMHGGHGRGAQDEHSAHYLKHLLKHAKEIGLTSEQISKLKAMRLDLGRTQARAEADIKIAHLELHALVEDEQADVAAIQMKVNQLKKVEGELLLAAIKGKRDATAMLTTDQREKDRALHEKMKSEKEGQHRGGMGGMGHGMGMMGGGGRGEHGGDGHESERAGGEEHNH